MGIGIQISEDRGQMTGKITEYMEGFFHRR